MKRVISTICLLTIMSNGCFSTHNYEPSPEEIRRLTQSRKHEKRIEQLTKERRRRDFVEKHLLVDDPIAICILAGKIRLGMTKPEVEASWGKPDDTNQTVGVWGIHEQWIYGGLMPTSHLYLPATYVYFENGILMSWQK